MHKSNVIKLNQPVKQSVARALLGFLCVFLALSASLSVQAKEHLLAPDKAFAAKVERAGDYAELILDIAPGYYLYKQSIKLNSEPESVLGKINLPAGKQKKDKFFGLQTIYVGKVRIPIALHNAPSQFTLTAQVRGCAEIAQVCYLPYTHILKIDEQGSLVQGLFSGNQSVFQEKANTKQTSQKTNIAPINKNHTAWFTTLLSYYLAGLVLAFTACMYPLLPILSTIIAGNSAQINRMRGFLLAFGYAQGLAVSYTLIGIIAALSGTLLTVWLQQSAVVIFSAILMLALALAMFGVWNMQLPATLQTTLVNTSNKLRGGKYLTVFGMGAISALIIGPCVAPPLALALGYIAKSGDILLGGISLYVMALGLGTPLIIIGCFGGSILPRAGAWMRIIKNMLGFIMLGVVIYMITPFISAQAVLILFGVLASGCGIYLLTNRPSICHQIDKVAGFFILIIAATQFVAAYTGSNASIDPLSLNNKHIAKQELQFQPISSLAELKQVLQKNTDKPVLLDFYADWCVVCKELDNKTFTDHEVENSMRQFILLRVDVTKNSIQQQELLKHFGLFGPPAIILFTNGGEENDRIIGFINAEKFKTRLQKIIDKHN